MRQIVINVPEKKFSFFMKLMKSLNFVEVIDQPATEDQLNADQADTWNNVKQGFTELQLEQEGKLKFRPIQELLDEL